MSDQRKVKESGLPNRQTYQLAGAPVYEPL